MPKLLPAWFPKKEPATDTNPFPLRYFLKWYLIVMVAEVAIATFLAATGQWYLIWGPVFAANWVTFTVGMLVGKKLR